MHEDCYGYIPLADGEFCTSLMDAEAVLGRTGSFLDVGCGLGEKMLLAQDLGWMVAGVEIRYSYAQVATAKDLSVFITDARYWSAYAAYDCVYVFHLLKDVEAEAALEKQIMSLMRSGALLILYGVSQPDWPAVGEKVWQKP